MTEIDFCGKNTPKIDICTANKPIFEKNPAEEKSVEKWLERKNACGKLRNKVENLSMFRPFHRGKTDHFF